MEGRKPVKPRFVAKGIQNPDIRDGDGDFAGREQKVVAFASDIQNAARVSLFATQKVSLVAMKKWQIW